MSTRQSVGCERRGLSGLLRSLPASGAGNCDKAIDVSTSVQFHTPTRMETPNSRVSRLDRSRHGTGPGLEARVEFCCCCRGRRRRIERIRRRARYLSVEESTTVALFRVLATIPMSWSSLAADWLYHLARELSFSAYAAPVGRMQASR